MSWASSAFAFTAQQELACAPLVASVPSGAEKFKSA